MKQIINGKLYNTDTAAFVCKYPVEDVYIGGGIDTCYIIFQKVNGEFFAAITQFDDFDNNIEYIEPLTFIQAAQLSERLMDVEDYIDVFGDVEE